MGVIESVNVFHWFLLAFIFITFCVVLRKEPLNPVIWFAFLFSFYFSSANLGNRTLIFSPEHEFQYLVQGVSLLASFSFGALLCSLIIKRRNAVATQRCGFHYSKRYIYASFLVILIFLPLFFVELVYAFKAWSSGMNYGQTRDYVLESRLVGNPGLIISLCLTFIYVITRNKLALMIFSLVVVFFLLIGERRDAAIAILVLLFFNYSVNRSQRSKRYLPIVIVVLMLAATAYGHIRAVIFSDITRVPAQLLIQASESPLALFLPLDSGEFFNVAAVSKSAYVFFDGEYNYGLNYISALYSVFPIIGRWSLLDTTRTAELLSQKYGESLVSQGVIGGTGGVAFGVDAYFAFGALGAAVIFFFFGFGLFFFYRLALRSSIFMRFAYASTLPIVVLHAGRSSIESVLPNLIKINLLPVISIVIIGLFFKILKTQRPKADILERYE